MVFRRKKVSKKQSAFSLIEVCIALMILSVGIVGAGKMLLTSTVCYSQSEVDEAAVVAAWSIANFLRVGGADSEIKARAQYWEQQLDAISRGARLTIDKKMTADTCVYTITLVFAAPNAKPIELKIAL